MSIPKEPRRLKDLIKLMDTMKQLQQQLLSLIRDKMQAMKGADQIEMQKLSEREQILIKRVQEREGFRHQLMDLIGQEVGLPSNRGRSLSVSQLTSYLPQGSSEVLLSKANALREVVMKVTQANRVVGATAREIVHHLTWVFNSVKPQATPSAVYSGSGVPVTCAQARLVDTVG